MTKSKFCSEKTNYLFVRKVSFSIKGVFCIFFCLKVANVAAEHDKCKDRLKIIFRFGAFCSVWFVILAGRSSSIRTNFECGYDGWESRKVLFIDTRRTYARLRCVSDKVTVRCKHVLSVATASWKQAFLESHCNWWWEIGSVQKFHSQHRIQKLSCQRRFYVCLVRYVRYYLLWSAEMNHIITVDYYCKVLFHHEDIEKKQGWVNFRSSDGCLSRNALT